MSEQVAREASRRPSQRLLVIGAGIAGIQVSLDVASAGYEVVLVERLPSIGGRMAQLSETFPTLDCAQCILTPKTVETGQHSNIRLLVCSEVVSVEGEAGHFAAQVVRHPTYVNNTLCTGCGLCQEKCPTTVYSDFQRGLGARKAIYTLSPQAVPNKPVIDRDHCRFFQSGKCRVCERVCPTGAINFDQQPQYVREEVGAIVLATGLDLYPLENLNEYGAGHIPDVIDSLAFERMLSASGPTHGQVRRPSDGNVPNEVVFIQCAGSRDPELHKSYCSKICCMYTAKQAALYTHRVPGGQAYVFYIDIRSAGKRYEEFVQRTVTEEQVIYLRGKVGKVFREGAKVVVQGTDTLAGRTVEVAADLVVIAPALVPARGNTRLAALLGVPVDSDGFFVETNGYRTPLETVRPGVFLAGVATGPKDIAETAAHASGAAGKVLSLFAGWRQDQR